MDHENFWQVCGLLWDAALTSCKSAESALLDAPLLLKGWSVFSAQAASKLHLSRLHS